MSQFAEVFSTMFANDTENHSIYKKMLELFCKIFENIETDQLCEIIRKSPTAIETMYYRLCN